MTTANSSSGRKRNDGSERERLHSATIRDTTAALHRDGEQARLVDLVRRRQLQQHEELSSWSQIQSAVWEIWDSYWYTDVNYECDNAAHSGGNHGRVRFDRHEHYADIVNPYRDRDVQLGDIGRRTTNAGKKEHKEEEEDGDMQTTPVKDTSRDEMIAKEIKPRPFAIRMILHTCRQILRLLRYGIHTTLDRLIILDNSQSSSSSSSSSNATIRYYRIRFTANDVMKCFALLYIGMKIGAWSDYHENVIVQVLGLMSVLGIVFRKQISHCHESSAVSSACDGLVAMHHFPQQQITQQRRREVTTVRQMPSELQSDTTTSTTASTTLLNSNKANLQQRQAIQRLQQKYPNATPAECKRFYICVKHRENEAAQRIENWLQRRSDCGLPLTLDTSDTSQNGGGIREYNHEFITRDQTLWNEAARLAMELDSKQGTGTDSSAKLPQIMCTYEERIYADATKQLSNTDTKIPSIPMGIESYESSNQLKQLPTYGETMSLVTDELMVFLL